MKTQSSRAPIMTTSSKTDLNATIEKRRSQIQEQIEMLQAKVEELGQDADWGCAGSMGHILESLRDLNGING